jgi:hypothetical protein
MIGRVLFAGSAAPTISRPTAPGAISDLTHQNGVLS